MVQSEKPKDSGFEHWLRSEMDQTPLPGELRVDVEDVTCEGRRRRRRRQTARRGLIGLAAAAVIGASVPLISNTLGSGQDNTTGVAASSCVGSVVVDASGAQRMLVVFPRQAGKIDVTLFSSPDCERDPSPPPIATVTIPSPAPGGFERGQVSGMSFYLVNGYATRASVNGVTATVVPSIGRQSVIWPAQSASGSTRDEPSRITWTVGNSTYAKTIATD